MYILCILALTNIASARLLVNVSDNRPEVPKNLKAEAISSTSILLTWSHSSPSGLAVLAYTVHYLPSDGGDELQQVSVNNSQLIEKLKPFTNYTFYVRAYSRRSASELSEFITQSTEEDIPSKSISRHYSKELGITFTIFQLEHPALC